MRYFLLLICYPYVFDDDLAYGNAQTFVVMAPSTEDFMKLVPLYMKDEMDDKTWDLWRYKYVPKNSSSNIQQLSLASATELPLNCHGGLSIPPPNSANTIPINQYLPPSPGFLKRIGSAY